MIKVKGFEAKFWTFPGGERSVKLMPQFADLSGNGSALEQKVQYITCDFKSSDDIMDLLLTVNALRNMVGTDVSIELMIPYFPFSRQDRVMTEGESFGLQVMANIINMCNFKRVTTWDIHSDVLAGMFPAGVFQNITQENIWGPMLGGLTEGKIAIVSPDAGALKKIYKVAKESGHPVIEATKVRDVATGHIVETRISAEAIKGFDTLIIVDDICDGGRTFVELAKVIRDSGFTGRLMLCVTHGIFSKGLDVFAGPDGFDMIVAMNNINNVDLDSFNSK